MRALFVMACLVCAGTARADLEALERSDARRLAAEHPVVVVQRSVTRSSLFTGLQSAVRQPDKHLPELAVSVATPGEVGAIVPLAPLIPQSGVLVRLGVQWSF
jgi:hypothetical protein